MKQALENDLSDATQTVEAIVARLPKLTLEDKVDVAARLGAIAKTLEAFDKAVKDDIKKHLKHKMGSVVGGMFKAILNLVPTDRLNQKELKEDQPGLFKQYTDTNPVERITFEAR